MDNKTCKYCQSILEICVDEGIECTSCQNSIHVKCLKRGSVPGGLNGDVFYSLVCQECAIDDKESFVRNKISWLQIICLVLYHLQTKSPGLARKGFFHWRHHIATFIDRHWEIIFPADVKKKKKWMGTIAGTLSHFSGYIFLSGTSVINEPAWWTLARPKLTPQAISCIYAKLLTQKQTLKVNKEKIPPDVEVYESILQTAFISEEYLETFNANSLWLSPEVDNATLMDTDFFPELSEECKKVSKQKNRALSKRKHNLSIISNPKKLMKLTGSASTSDDFTSHFSLSDAPDNTAVSTISVKKEESAPKEIVKLFDPFCHYNTSLNSIARLKGLSLQAKLTGGIKQDLILSPYSQIYLKPFIRRDTETFPTWLKLMAELQFVANRKNQDYVLPPRAPLVFTYVQPEHIPAINSICNQFFWPGIDDQDKMESFGDCCDYSKLHNLFLSVSESLQYPDFSCVVLYKQLIIAFAFLVPDVKRTENYLSFLFTRPFWRNCGIAKFMVYHLIQASLGKDITLHVSVNNPALFLYQKFGFKVENVVLDFYDKYYRTDVNDSKHAYFCRLER